MRRQFSIADLLSLTATFAVLFASYRWLGYDGAILATPFGGVVVAKLLTSRCSESTRSRWLRAFLAASIVAIAVCLVDPRLYGTTAGDLAFGIPICFLYGFIATAALEGLLKIVRRLRMQVAGARSRCFI
jgi:hypothetical protein